jgi:signal transduction histidine kinase
VAIAKAVPSDLPEVPMDAGLLARALANLVANAIRGTADGGRIEITAAMERGDLEIAVADEGPVPTPDRLDELFERGLAGSDPLDSGVPHGHAPAGPAARPGLGSTRAIAEAHDGSLRHEHRRGGGNRFVLRLPGRVAPARAA